MVIMIIGLLVGGGNQDENNGVEGKFNYNYGSISNEGITPITGQLFLNSDRSRQYTQIQIRCGPP